MDNLRLKALRVVNYRAFKDLHIAHLGRVNLFVGRNNIGKTSLLEAIWLYVRRGASSVIREILLGRDESRLPLISDSEAVFETNFPLRYLFYGRPYQSGTGTTFSIGTNGIQETLSVTIQAYREERDPARGSSRFVPVLPDAYELEEEATLGWVVQFGDYSSPVRNLGRLVDRGSAFGSYESSEHAAVMVSANGPSRSQIAAWRDRSILEGKKQHVLRALQLIEPKVEDIDLVSMTSIDQRPRETDRIPVVKLRGIDEFITLKSLGDGVSRMFVLALALVNAQDGVLLVDEIENGLHYSVQADMWRFVMKIATEINVQVFATTHSKDCVDAFSEASRDDAAEGVLIRLGYKDGNIIATIFDEDTLEAVTDQDIEIR